MFENSSYLSIIKNLLSYSIVVYCCCARCLALWAVHYIYVCVYIYIYIYIHRAVFIMTDLWLVYTSASNRELIIQLPAKLMFARQAVFIWEYIELHMYTVRNILGTARQSLYIYLVRFQDIANYFTPVTYQASALVEFTFADADIVTPFKFFITPFEIFNL